MAARPLATSLRRASFAAGRASLVTVLMVVVGLVVISAARPAALSAQTRDCVINCGGSGTYCPTWISWGQVPGDPSYQTSVQITVYYGQQQSVPDDPCTAVSGSPNPSTFHFTVNGVDRTSYFTVYSDHAVGTNVPLVDQQLNTLIAQITGNTASGSQTINQITQSTNVNTTPAPIVSTTLYNFDDQQAGRCAVNCFGAAYSFSTVPYYTMGTARNVTLVYQGDHASPRPFIHVDVTHPSGASPPQQFWLEAKITGVSVTFLNGETQLHFAYATGQVRLGGQFDATAYTTGMYPLDIIVSSKYASTVVQTVIHTKLLVVNEGVSPAIAYGWTVAGVQRLYFQADSSALITEGDGSAVYFARSCNLTCSYTTPSGDFTQVVDGTDNARWKRLYPDSTKVVFDSTGRAIQLIDRFGNTTTITYDFLLRPWKIQDPTGRQITLNYGGALFSISDPMGRTTAVTVAYNAYANTNLLYAIKDPDGDSTTFAYDASWRLSTITDRGGNLTRLVYKTPSWELDSLVMPAVSINGGANASPAIAYAPWQLAGVPTGSTATTPLTPVATPSVVGGVTDPEGHTSTFTVDHWGQPVTVTDQAGRITYIYENTAGQLTQVTHPWGSYDFYDYDASGRVIYYGPAPAPATRFHYGAFGQPDSIWGDFQPTLKIYLGMGGRADSVRIAGLDSLKYRLTYDTQGRVLSVTDPKGHSNRIHYDASFGNQDSTLAPASGGGLLAPPGRRFTKIKFDRYGRDSAMTATGLPWQVLTYDVMNRTTNTYDGVNGNPTSRRYDHLFLTRVQDPKGQVYRFAYNALGWVTQQFDPADTLNRYQSYRYNRDGLVTGATNRRGQSLSYNYDNLHRQLFAAAGSAVPDSFAYNTNGTIAVGWNGVSRDSVFLDAALAPDSVVTRIAGRRFRIVYYRNNSTRLDSTKVADDAGIRFVDRLAFYNGLTGGLDSLGLDAGRVRLGLNGDGLGTLVTLPTSPALVFGTGYTALHAPMRDSLSTTTLDNTLGHKYGYDDPGRLSFEVNPQQNSRRNFAYDGVGRLTSVTYRHYNGTGGCSVTEEDGWSCSDLLWFTDSTKSYGYDGANNRTDQSGTYNAGNRIVTFAGSTFEHDLDGNVSRKYGGGSDVHYYWSAANQLDSVVAGTTHILYGYDAFGRLVRKSRNGAVQRYFLWDGDQVLAELDTNARKRVAEYAYYPGIDRPLALVSGDTAPTLTRYFAQDELGNVRGLLNNSTIVQQVTYDAWGQQQLTGALGDTSRLRWKGLMWEGDSTRLYYVRERWLDPTTGRFLSEDLEGLNAGINLYTFAHADPIQGFDPWGLDDYYDGCADHGFEDYTPGGSATRGDTIIAIVDCSAARTEHNRRESFANWVRESILELACMWGCSRVDFGALGVTLSDLKASLGRVHGEVGKLPKGEPGKFGSPQRGTPELGYRLDPGHPNRAPGDPEAGPHINWWDWTGGKRGAGGRWGVVPIPPEGWEIIW